MSNSVLSEMEWDECVAIPVANAENKALEGELRRKENERNQVENGIEKLNATIQALSEHFRNVTQELPHSLALCKTKEREKASEEHFQALAEREGGRLQQEITRQRNELGVLREKEKTQESDISKNTQSLEELRKQPNCDQHTLDAWLEKLARQDEDIMAIVKYSQQDELRIKSLTLAIEKTTLEANQKRKALDNELTETIAAQIGLDKSAENLHQAHQERQELFCQWGRTIEQTRKRYAEMQQCTLQLARVEQELRDGSATIKEKRGFLANEEENNNDHRRNLARAYRRADKLRRNIQEQEHSRSWLQDELNTLKGTMYRAATDVESLRSQLSSVRKDIQDKTDKLMKAELHNIALEEKLMIVTQVALTVEERVAQRDQLFKEEEQAIKAHEMQLHHHREALFHQKQNLKTARMKEKDLEAQMLGSKAVISSLDCHQRKLDQNVLKQQEIINNQDFQIQQLERKAARLQGGVNMEARQAWEQRTAALAAALEEGKTTAVLIGGRRKELEDYIRCVTREVEKTGAETRELASKTELLLLFNDTSDKELRTLKKKKQDAMVDDNILRLEIRHLRDLLYNKADSVLSLEKRKLEVQTAMRRRKEEIRVHMEMLSKQFRIAERERQELSVEVREKESKKDIMRARYETLTFSMAPPEGEEEMSQAYYIIRAGQEKEELKRKGDNLDAKIRKMETEKKAFGNTIQLVNSCNLSFGKSFNTVPESAPEHKKKCRLEEQQIAAEGKHKYHRRQIGALQDDIQGMNDTLERLTQEEQMRRKQTEETKSRTAQLNKEVDSQKQKLERVKKQCSKLTREIRPAKGSRARTFEERDVALRENIELYKTINRVLCEAMEWQPHLRAVIEEYFSQANLSPPSPVSTPASRQSSVTSSARSSASLRSSASSASSSPRSSALQSPTSRTFKLGLGLSVTSPPRSASPYPASSSSSSSSSHYG